MPLRTPAFPALTSNLVSQRVGEDLVVYNPEDERAHCFVGEAAEIFALCDGITPISAHRFSAEQLSPVFHEFQRLGLLEAELPEFFSRRDFVKGGLALGVVTSLTMPLPAAADSSLCAAASCGAGNVLVTCICTMMMGMVVNLCTSAAPNCGSASGRCNSFCAMMGAMVQTFSCCEC